MERSEMKNLKLNYHMLESCNYKCKFCFAKYANKPKLKYDQMKLVIEKTAECGYFTGINFAGGEPLLIPEISDLIQFAKEKGLTTSVITNGFFLTNEKLDSMLPYLDCIGISVHSVCDDIKIELGSCTKVKQILSNERLREICNYIRAKSTCKIKINTVVNSLNKDELFRPFIKDLGIDRWKILRCQSFGKNNDMCISDEEWNAFCKRNGGLYNSVFENNMKDTYIMVNPAGDLVKEGEDCNSYEEIGSVLDEGMEDLLLRHPLHIDEYHSRYAVA